MSEPKVDNAPMVDEEIAAPPEQAVAETAPPAAEHKTMASAGGVSLNETQFPLAIVLVASIVLIIALDAEYDWNKVCCAPYRFVCLFYCMIYNMCSPFVVFAHPTLFELFLTLRSNLRFLTGGH